jgi:hypothetical protein
MKALLLFALVLTGCGKLGGTWLAGCNAGGSDSKRDSLVFDGENYTSSQLKYVTLDCTGTSVTDNEKKGTFEIGEDVDAIPDAQAINFVQTVPDAKTTYSIFKRDGDTLYFGTKDGDFDGTAPEKRFNKLSGDAHETYTLQ